MPDLKTAIGVDLRERLSAFHTVPVLFPTVTKAYVPVPPTAVHLVYPNIALDS
jgi:hypothetical protein